MMMGNNFLSSIVMKVSTIGRPTCKAKDCNEQATHLWAEADGRFCDKHFPIFKRKVERDLAKQGIEVEWVLDENTREDIVVANWKLNKLRR